MKLHRRCVVMLAIALLSRSATAADVEAILRQMTPLEKVTLLGGVDGFCTRPIERLGIPTLQTTDASAGVRLFGRNTAYPAPVLLAATWDVDLAEEYGRQVGRDCIARNAQVLLGPGINLTRNPRNGRNFEYMGEDPMLAGAIAVPYVRGVQGAGVSCTLKHFAANNQETDRFEMTAQIDERTLRERYLRAFEHVIRDADPGAVMCSYNRLNGAHASANKWLLTDVLRGDWKYNGLVMSDWEAVHSTLGPIASGLDLEMPSPKFLSPQKVLPLVDNGVVPQAVIDEKVRHLLSWMNRFGWLGKTLPSGHDMAADDPQSVKVALETARGGLTLLKNQGTMLPLDKTTIKKLVVLGPNATDTPVGGGGSSQVRPRHSVSFADGLAIAFGADRVRVVMTDPLQRLTLHPQVDGDVFHAEYFANATLDGEPVSRGEAHSIDFDAPPVDRLPDENFSVRYRATITLAADAEYLFSTTADDGARVLLDGKSIIDDWAPHAAHRRTAKVKLSAGHKYELVLEYFNGRADAVLKFACGVTPPALDAEDQAALRDADAVVVCLGFGPATEHEGADRTFALPPGQDELVETALAANRRVVVVLNAGGSCDVAPWIDRVPALLHAYYAGQEGGTALAKVLTGVANPSGHLPFVFEKTYEDVPSARHFGDAGVNEYAEGLFCGQRGLDRANIAPRFPFGFGLSYTTFALANAAARVDGQDVVVSVDVANTGSRDGQAVVQCYAEPPAGRLPRPMRELRAFTKPALAAGQRRRVELRFPQRELSTWDPIAAAWALTPGTYTLRLGFDAATFPASASIELK